MPGFLRQSTASQSRALGPFVDSGDFLTPETGLTIANTDIKLVVNGGASANKNSGGGTHRVNGVYGVTFDATDSAVVGEMEVSVVVAGALPVFDKFIVLEEAVYDALFAASAGGYMIPGSTERNAIADAILTRAITEAYAADGAAPTLAQFMSMMIAFQFEKNISATTITCKKLDGSTTALTLTINDATTPTTITRAT